MPMVHAHGGCSEAIAGHGGSRCGRKAEGVEGCLRREQCLKAGYETSDPEGIDGIGW